MKNNLIISVFTLAILLVSTTGSAGLMVFEYNYSNDAWGHQNRGCFVDENGNAYNYDMASGEPIHLMGNVGKKQFSRAKELLEKAADGSFVARRHAADAGISSWCGNLYGKQIKLRQTGDLLGKNSAPEAEELAKMIDAWCGLQKD